MLARRVACGCGVLPMATGMGSIAVASGIQAAGKSREAIALLLGLATPDLYIYIGLLSWFSSIYRLSRRVVWAWSAEGGNKEGRRFFKKRQRLAWSAPRPEEVWRVSILLEYI